MAPLSQAVKCKYKNTDSDGCLIYEGVVDPEWTIAAIPHGGEYLCIPSRILAECEPGYALGLILDAALQAQASTSHKDVCHCTAHFLRSAMVKPYTVKVNRLRVGKGFSNITADLIQDDTVRISAHFIFTTLPDPPAPQLPSKQSLTLTQPSPYARLTPHVKPPSRAKLTRLSPKFVFKHRFAWAEDQKTADKINEENAKAGKGGMEWLGYIHLTDQADEFTVATLPFCGDMFRNLPELLPRDQRTGPSWFPTMVLTLDFKVKLSANTAKRTVGLWSSGKFMQDGRHDNSVEVWTAPCELGDHNARLPKDWRKDQHCVLIASQMALTLPLAVNEKRAKL